MQALERFPIPTQRTFEALSRLLWKLDYTTVTQSIYLLVLDVVLDFVNGDVDAADRIIDDFAASLHSGVREAAAMQHIAQPKDTLQ